MIAEDFRGMQSRVIELAFLGTAGVLLKEGTNLIDCLNLTSGIISTENMFDETSNKLRAALEELPSSGSLAAVFRKYDLISPVGLGYIAVGEATGALDTTLIKAAKYHALDIALGNAQGYGSDEKVTQEQRAEVLFYHALADFYNVGFPLSQSLETIATFTSHSSQDAIQRTAERVSKKTPLSEALAAEPSLNNPYVVERLKVAEGKPESDLTQYLPLLVHELKFKYTQPPSSLRNIVNQPNN